MAKQNSTKVKIIANSLAIAEVTDASLEVNRNMIDVTTKDSNSWKRILPGLKDASMNGSAIVDYQAAGIGPDDIFNYLTNGTIVVLEFSDAITGDSKYTCSGYVNKFSQTAGTEDVYKYSFDITVDGAVTQATI